MMTTIMIPIMLSAYRLIILQFHALPDLLHLRVFLWVREGKFRDVGRGPTAAPGVEGRGVILIILKVFVVLEVLFVFIISILQSSYIGNNR